MLGFEVLLRIKQINKVKLYRAGSGQTDRHPLLALMTRSIRWDLIGQQYDQIIKYATATPAPRRRKRSCAGSPAPRPTPT